MGRADLQRTRERAGAASRFSAWGACGKRSEKDEQTATGQQALGCPPGVYDATAAAPGAEVAARKDIRNAQDAEGAQGIRVSIYPVYPHQQEPSRRSIAPGFPIVPIATTRLRSAETLEAHGAWQSDR